jgi:mannose-6-phosphate isomerase
MMRLVDNPVRHYAWGSVEAIPRLLGVEPDGRPQAELWLGAHERAGSRVLGPDGRTGLLDLVRDDPQAQLGTDWAHARRMPFLAKVIAVARPLSLQVHPDARLAARWCAHEEERGLAPTDPRRTCPDDVAKVEMVWALSEFRALCGFRALDEAVAWTDVLDVPALASTAGALRADGEPALRAVVQRLLALPDPPGTVARIAAAAATLRHDPRWAESAQAAADLAARYPDDPAVALALLLRPVRLAPGEAMFVAAGQPHCYLSGTAFEVQANSDNVVRGGLTDKHVEVDRLLEALDTGEGVWEVTGVRHGPEEVFAPATGRFALGVVRRAEPGVRLAPVAGPQVLLCVDGEFRVATGDEDALVLVAGESAWVPAGSGFLRAAGGGTLLRVTTGRARSGEADGTSGAPPDRHADRIGPDPSGRQTR